MKRASPVLHQLCVCLPTAVQNVALTRHRAPPCQARPLRPPKRPRRTGPMPHNGLEQPQGAGANFALPVATLCRGGCPAVPDQAVPGSAVQPGVAEPRRTDALRLPQAHQQRHKRFSAPRTAAVLSSVTCLREGRKACSALPAGTAACCVRGFAVLLPRLRSAAPGAGRCRTAAHRAAARGCARLCLKMPSSVLCEKNAAFLSSQRR